MKVFIIILNFNGGRDILECLSSLKHEEANIIVVDNGSGDGSVEKIEKLKIKNYNSKLKVIENKKNLGFAAGMNVGIRYALKKGAEAVLLLNQDTVIEEDFFKPLLENPADIVSPVIKFKRTGEWVYDFGGKINWWIGRVRHFEAKDQRPMTKDPVDYVSGCAMLIKKSVLEKIGFLDRKFFLYFEDVDFCLRAKKAGFRIAVEPKSIIVHKLSEKEKKPFKQHLQILRSNLIFINRYLPVYRRPIAYFYLKLLLFKILLNQI